MTCRQPNYCSSRRQELGYIYGNKLVDAVFKTCENGAATRFQDQGLKAVTLRLSEYKPSEPTAKILLETKGYSFDDVILRMRIGSGEFKTAFDKTNAALANAKAETETIYQAALEATTESIATAYSAAEPFTESENVAQSACQPFAGFLSDRLRPIGQLCAAMNRDLQKRRERKECDNIRAEIDAPDDIQKGYLNVPTLLSGMQSVPIRDILCQSHRERTGLTIINNSGFFSTEYRIVRKMRFSGLDVEFSAKLNEPNSGTKHWSFSDGEIEQGTINAKEFGNGSDGLVGCLYYLEACYRP